MEKKKYCDPTHTHVGKGLMEPRQAKTIHTKQYNVRYLQVLTEYTLAKL